MYARGKTNADSDKKETTHNKFDTMQMMQILHREPLPVTLTSSGFGDPEGNGVLTQIGDWEGSPLYQAAGGWYVWKPELITAQWSMTIAEPQFGGGELRYPRYDLTSPVSGKRPGTESFRPAQFIEA